VVREFSLKMGGATKPSPPPITRSTDAVNWASGAVGGEAPASIFRRRRSRAVERGLAGRERGQGLPERVIARSKGDDGLERTTKKKIDEGAQGPSDTCCRHPPRGRNLRLGPENCGGAEGDLKGTLKK